MTDEAGLRAALEQAAKDIEWLADRVEDEPGFDVGVAAIPLIDRIRRALTAAGEAVPVASKLSEGLDRDSRLRSLAVALEVYGLDYMQTRHIVAKVESFLEAERASPPPMPSDETVEALNLAQEALDHAKLTGENPTTQRALEHNLERLAGILRAALRSKP